MRNRAWVPGARTAALCFICISLAPLCVLCRPAAAALDNSGRWTGTWNWGATAVHLMLVPSDTSAFHSRVVWWEDRHDSHVFVGGMWGWTTNSSLDCSDSAGAYFTNLSLGTNVPASDVFCAGHVPLMGTSGKLFVSGGTEHGEVGIYNTNLLTPGTSGNKWSVGPTMSDRRWYPTNTRLWDGTILVSSGSKYSHEQIVGGRTTGDVTLNTTLRRLGLSVAGDWDASISAAFDSDTTKWLQYGVSGHTLISIDTVLVARDGQLARKNVVNVMFGGERVDPSSQKRISVSDAWFPRRDASPIGTEYAYWFQPVSVKYQHPNEAGLLSRSDHTMTAMARDNDDSASVFVFGGRRLRVNQSTLTLSDVWRFYWHDDGYSGRLGWTWQNFGTLANGPSARFGHAAVYDPFNRRVLVFGGTNDSSNALDNAVYALDVSNPRNPQWVTPIVIGTPPAARFGHRMMLETTGRRRHDLNGNVFTDQYGAILFGGNTSSGLDTTVYMLWMTGHHDTLEWHAFNVATETGGTFPSGRVFHTLTKDELNDRWMVFGGDGPATPEKAPGV